jgi:hypothetical protein
MVVQHSHVVDHHVVGSLQEGRVNCHDRPAASSRQASREAEGMLRKVEADSLAYTLTRHQWDEGLSTAIDVKNTSATLLNSRARLLQARLMAVLKRYLADRLSPSSALRGMEAEWGRDYETEMKINNLRINN